MSRMGVNTSDKKKEVSKGNAEWDLREVTFFVRDFQRSMAFYQSIMGMGLGFEQDGYAQFELNGPVLAIHVAEGDRERAGKENHIAFRVGTPEAVDRVYNQLKERGVRFEPYDEGGSYDENVLAEPRNFEWGYRCIFFRDPDGNLIEVFAKLR